MPLRLKNQEQGIHFFCFSLDSCSGFPFCGAASDEIGWNGDGRRGSGGGISRSPDLFFIKDT